MSDQEYYAGSPYDELEEMLWDADPNPDLADDLAQHAAHSPVWQDDPVGELEPYHSDWEYYSDDYYDDDPAILKNISTEGIASRQQNTKTQKRARKRKFEETQSIAIGQEMETLVNTIRGTVWAHNRPRNTRIFRQGQDIKVALLTDWKERFRMFNGRTISSEKGHLSRDESWANDLSLEDMGLVHSRSNPEIPDNMIDELDNTEAENAEDGIHDEDTLSENEAPNLSIGDPNKEPDRSSPQSEDVHGDERINNGLHRSLSQSKRLTASKRRRVAGTSPLLQHQTENPEPKSNGALREGDVEEDDSTTVHSPQYHSPVSQSASIPQVTTSSKLKIHDLKGSNRKRKRLSDIDKDEQLQSDLSTGLTDNLASAGNKKQKSSQIADESPAPPSRNTRSRKR